MNYAPQAPYGVAMATALAQGTAIGAQGASGFVTRLVRLPVSLFKVLYVWQQRAADRQRLRLLGDRLLDDIGMDRASMIRETALPFWRVS